MIVTDVRILAITLLIAAFWLLAYFNLMTLAEIPLWFMPVERHATSGEVVFFFFYETLKVMLLLTGVVFIMGIIRTFFTPERTRAILAHHGGRWNTILAAMLGIVTPFCSCSAVPLFIGFLTAGVPLGVTFAFLIAAPMINEVALALLFSLFGWQIALLYLTLGLTVAISSGMIIGWLKLEALVEDWVLTIPKPIVDNIDSHMPWPERIHNGYMAVWDIVGKIWPYVLLGIGVGAWIHGYVPANFMADFMGKDVWWSLPLAVILGIPMYANAATIIPVVESLLNKGAALGTVLAFMMAVVALSLPEILILRKVLRPQLLVVFVGIVGLGILLVGYVFNYLL